VLTVAVVSLIVQALRTAIFFMASSFQWLRAALAAVAASEP
jgi:hypothetical protein